MSMVLLATGCSYNVERPVDGTLYLRRSPLETLPGSTCGEHGGTQARYEKPPNRNTLGAPLACDMKKRPPRAVKGVLPNEAERGGL